MIDNVREDDGVYDGYFGVEMPDIHKDRAARKLSSQPSQIMHCTTITSGV